MHVLQGQAAQEPQPAQALDTGTSFMAAVTDAAAPMPGMEQEPQQEQEQQQQQQQHALFLPAPNGQVQLECSHFVKPALHTQSFVL